MQGPSEGDSADTVSLSEPIRTRNHRVSLIENDVALTMANVAAVFPFALPPAYLAVRSFFVGIWLDSRRLDAENDNGLFTGGRDSALTSPREQCGRK